MSCKQNRGKALIIPFLFVCVSIFSWSVWQNIATAIPITSGLIAYWAGDGDATDSSVNTNHGTFAAETYAPGKFGQAFSLDGQNDLVAVPDRELWTFGGDFSINMWVNLGSVTPSEIGQPGNSVFIGHDDGSGLTRKWFFGLGAGELYFHINSPGNGSAFLAQTSFSPNLDEWHNLGLTRSGDTYTIFIDGVGGTSQTFTLPILNSGSPLTIGSAEGFFTDGLIDDVALYDRALTQSEIQTIVNAEPVPEPATIALLGIGLAGLGGRYLRKRIKRKK